MPYWTRIIYPFDPGLVAAGADVASRDTAGRFVGEMRKKSKCRKLFVSLQRNAGVLDNPL